MSDDALILHHYDFSNYSEKVRLVLGHKSLSWCGVEIPSYEPKPEYTPLTAGYRRTPALQVGADVYCDTSLIVEVLEQHRPSPSIFPDTPAARVQCDAWVYWAERAMFQAAALYITGVHARRFPDAFHSDRARLHHRPEPDVARVEASAARFKAQLEPNLKRLEALVQDCDEFVLGKDVTLADFALYLTPWFLNVIDGSRQVIEEYPGLEPWFERVAAVGHGNCTTLAAGDALDIARRSEPVAVKPDQGYVAPEGFAPGDEVVITPVDEAAPAAGVLVAVSAERLTIRAHHDACGTVHVHFPRLGYRVRKERPSQH